LEVGLEETEKFFERLKNYLGSSVRKNWKIVLILLNIFIFLEDEK